MAKRKGAKIIGKERQRVRRKGYAARQAAREAHWRRESRMNPPKTRKWLQMAAMDTVFIGGDR